jgi:hypothetical protein
VLDPYVASGRIIAPYVLLNFTVSSSVKVYGTNLTFRGPGIVIYSYSKTNEMHSFLKFIFGINLYMFRTVPLSIIRSLALYTQQQVYVIQVMLTAC